MEPLDSALYVDIRALLAGGLPGAPQPSVLSRVDGVRLFYASQVNVLFGEPETGKTWIALAALAEALADGSSGQLIDLDHSGVESTVTRLVGLGVSLDVLADPTRFRYTEPEDADWLVRVVADTENWRPNVVIVDSVGELLPLLGLGSNSPDDFTAAHSGVLKPMARIGACVIAIDHVAKNASSRRMGPTGTAAKRRAVGGTSLRVELLTSFAPGRGGAARLSVHKDRHGGLRRYCDAYGAHEPVVGRFVLTEDGARLSWSIVADDGNTVRDATDKLVADVVVLDALQPAPISQRDVLKRLGWGSDRAMAALQAWRALRSADAPEEHGASSCIAVQIGAPRCRTFASRSAEHYSLNGQHPPATATLDSPEHSRKLRIPITRKPLN